MTHHSSTSSLALLLLIIVASSDQCTRDASAAVAIDTSLINADGIITFDDLGFEAGHSWTLFSDTLDSAPFVLLNTTEQKIILTGEQCAVSDQVFGTGGYDKGWDGAQTWYGDGSEKPGFYLGVSDATLYCEITFEPPIAEFSMRAARVYDSTLGVTLYDESGAEISCEITPQINTSFAGLYNVYHIFGIKALQGQRIAKIKFEDSVQDLIQWKSCGDGFTKKGSICEDVDECNGNPCSADATCTNNSGSFTCQCNDGFTGTGIGANGCTRLLGQNPPGASPSATSPTKGPQSIKPNTQLSSASKLTAASVAITFVAGFVL